jgi:tRNA-modifying protein YgfZ
MGLARQCSRLKRAGDDNDHMTPTQPIATQAHPLQPEGICRLTDWGVMRASGEEAAKFLQGQLTQDVLQLGAASGGTARLAGYCSPKGRLLATLVVWPAADGSLLLACSADVLPATLKRLQMFVMRAKCKLTDASTEWPLYGVAGHAAAQALGVPADLPVWGQANLTQQVNGEVVAACAVRLPDAVAASHPSPRHLWASAAVPPTTTLAEDTWRWLEVHSGVARVTAATSEQFVPQMVNLEVTGGVNFQKGCYPGQEVVARSQYRGTLKRRAQMVLGSLALSPGQEIFNSADPEQPAGMVVLAGHNAASGATPFAALAELKLAALDGGTLHLGAATGPLLQLGTLPYALPVTQD